MADGNVISVGMVRSDVLKMHIAACVASAKRGKASAAKGDEDSTEMISVIVHYKALIGTGTTSWPTRVCKEVVVSGIEGGPLDAYLRTPFTGIVLIYSTADKTRFQASAIPVETVKNMEQGERLEVWLPTKVMIQMLSMQSSSSDNLILLVAPHLNKLDVIISSLVRETDGEELKLMTAPEGDGIEHKGGYYSSLGGMLHMDDEFQPRHVIVFSATSLVAKLRTKQQKNDDVCTLSIKTSADSPKSAVVLNIGDRHARMSKITFLFERETPEALWINCRDSMAGALPLGVAAAATTKAVEEERPRKKIRFENEEEFNTFVMGGDDDDDEIMPEPTDPCEAMDNSVRIYSEADTMTTVTKFRFRLDNLLKALEPLGGDISAVYLMVHCIEEEGDNKMALIDMVAPTTQSRGLIVSRFVSVTED
jgi:hypothetical protein